MPVLIYTLKAARRACWGGLVEKGAENWPPKGSDFCPLFTAHGYAGGRNEGAESYNTSVKDEERLATSKTAGWTSGDGEIDGVETPPGLVGLG